MLIYIKPILHYTLRRYRVIPHYFYLQVIHIDFHYQSERKHFYNSALYSQADSINEHYF